MQNWTTCFVGLSQNKFWLSFSEKLEGENDVVQFADDTSIICKIEGNENIPQKIEKTLEQTDNYLNKLGSRVFF